MTEPEHNITIRGRSYAASYGEYEQGRMAITYNDPGTGQRFSVLTVNLPSAHLAEGEFAVKTWSENAATVKAALETGLFVDTGKRIPTGFVEASVWKFKETDNG